VSGFVLWFVNILPPFHYWRAKGVKHRQAGKEAVAGFFSHIGEGYNVHHMWGEWQVAALHDLCCILRFASVSVAASIWLLLLGSARCCVTQDYNKPSLLLRYPSMASEVRRIQNDPSMLYLFKPEFTQNLPI